MNIKYKSEVIFNQNILRIRANLWIYLNTCIEYRMLQFFSIDSNEFSKIFKIVDEAYCLSVVQFLNLIEWTHRHSDRRVLIDWTDCDDGDLTSERGRNKSTNSGWKHSKTQRHASRYQLMMIINSTTSNFSIKQNWNLKMKTRSRILKYRIVLKKDREYNANFTMFEKGKVYRFVSDHPRGSHSEK